MGGAVGQGNGGTEAAEGSGIGAVARFRVGLTEESFGCVSLLHSTLLLTLFDVFFCRIMLNIELQNYYEIIKLLCIFIIRLLYL